MAVSFLAHEVSDICIGKPALRSLPVSATVGAAVSALRRSGEIFLSVWSCECAAADNDTVSRTEKVPIEDRCRCVGKVCMVDVVCFLCGEENLKSPSSALQSPISVLLPKGSGTLVRHLQSDSSLIEAIDLILQGAQNLVVPIHGRRSQINSIRKLLNAPASLDSTIHHNGQQYCWLSQEDVLRFLLNSISIFSPIPAFSIQSVDIIDSVEGLTVPYTNSALSILPALARSLLCQTSIAVLDEDNKLIGEISPLTIARCDETVVAALVTLSLGDFMAYVDCSNPPEDLVRAVKGKLEERNHGGVIEFLEEVGFSSVSSSCSSSDDEFGLGKRSGSGRILSRLVRGSEAVACCPGSSLVAVMIQALAYRVNYVWVVEDDYTLAGIVTFAGMLKVFREQIRAMKS